MVNIFTIAQLISGVIFGTLSLVSLINAMIILAMLSIIGMFVAEFGISIIESYMKAKDNNSS